MNPPPTNSMTRPILGGFNFGTTIHTVDMHTSGEATRIIYAGYPTLHGSTLLQQRAEAGTHHDWIREMLILEPRGHVAMYGAILCASTELVEKGDADIGVLFITNEGYSTMCGHASIALGRFLVDCQDEGVFPGQGGLAYDKERGMVRVRLHAPCGIVELSVRTLKEGRTSDPARPVAFLSVPSFASRLGLEIRIPTDLRWPELPTETVVVDIAYGGAFYALVPASALGFPTAFANLDTQMAALNEATRLLKKTIMQDARYKEVVQHPEHDELSFLYSIMVVEDSPVSSSQPDSETGLCFFGDQQIDRSPTGGAVAARVAAAYAKGRREVGEEWTYQSVVSRAMGGGGGFRGTIERVERVGGRDGEGREAVVVRVEGKAYYTGFHEFVREREDPVMSGFLLERLYKQ